MTPNQRASKRATKGIFPQLEFPEAKSDYSQNLPVNLVSVWIFMETVSPRHTSCGTALLLPLPLFLCMNGLCRLFNGFAANAGHRAVFNEVSDWPAHGFRRPCKTGERVPWCLARICSLLPAWESGLPQHSCDLLGDLGKRSLISQACSVHQSTGALRRTGMRNPGGGTRNNSDPGGRGT